MQSTWISGQPATNGGGANGIGYLLAQRNADNQQAMQQLAQVGRGLGSAIGGAVQAYHDPAAFGPGTSSGFAALKGAAMNYNNATTGDGANFKQFAAMGKTADSLREAMKFGVSSTPDQQPKVLGFTDDEWKHIGTDKKIAALQGFQESQLMQAREQGLQQGALQMAQMAEAAQARRQFQQNLQGARLGKGLDAMSAGHGPVNPQLNMEDYAQVAMNSVTDPLQASQIMENFSRAASYGAKAEAGTDLNPTWIEDPTTGARFLGRGNTTLPSGINPKMVTDGPKVSSDGRFYNTGKGWATIKELGFPEGSKFVEDNGRVSVIGPDGRILDWKQTDPFKQALSAKLGGNNAGNSTGTGAGSNPIIKMVKDPKTGRYVFPK